MKKGLFISMLALLAVGACGSKETIPYPDEDKALTKAEVETFRPRVIADWRNERMPLADKIIAGKAQWTPNKDFKKEKKDWGYFQVSDASKHVMKFFVDVYGDEPAGGRSLWISLHGGGADDTPDFNNYEWENQQVMYRRVNPAQPEEGVYVAPRAFKDAADLWFFRDNDGLFRQIIETMVLKYNVNPDKVYLLGYSAGGDGLWRMAPRLADHWAAASMMAGHPGTVRFENLRNLPFMMWVGENDTAYNRNKLVPEAAKRIEALRKNDDPKSSYLNECHVLAGKPHWMDLEDAAAFKWMRKFTRNPYPKKIVWRQEAEEKKMIEAFFYWLKIADAHISGDDATKEPWKNYQGFEITAEIDGNTIRLSKCDYDKFTIYLNDSMVDLDKNVVVTFNGKELFNGKVERTLKVMRQSMRERNDPSYCFPAQIIIKK